MKALPLSCLLFLLCLSPVYLLAQDPYLVKGSVLDTASSVKLRNAAVSVLNEKDSMLVKFCWVNADGSFFINNLVKGHFILLVTYPGYADYVESFALDSLNNTHDFGPINMVTKARLLFEIVIRGEKVSITMKGDTTEFLQGSFVVQPNAKVENLLKQLPGITVDKDGNISARGERVSKVLVDGEEFFGDDPTLVTRNIRGDMVEKIQLYDKKSDRATFTGIDDGEKNKTLNIVLKEDKKSGYFGKADAGGGSDNYYQSQGMLNVFEDKMKIAAYGTIGNTGRTGLDYDSNSNLSPDGVLTSDEIESFDGRYEGNGLPSARTGGAHYDSKWKNDKHALNINYKIGTLNVEGSNTTNSLQNLASGVINRRSEMLRDNTIFRKKLDATYKVQLNSSYTLNLYFNGTLKNNKISTSNNGFSTTDSDLPLNSERTFFSNELEQQAWRGSISLSKTFAKKGRTMYFFIGQSLETGKAEGYLNSSNEFYDTRGMSKSIQNINQYKTNDNKSSALNYSLVYSEPLSKSFSAVIDYGMNINTSLTRRDAFNISSSGYYDIRDNDFSNNFNYKQSSHFASLNVYYRKSKTLFDLGTRVTGTVQKQTDLLTTTKYKISFFNLIPQARYQYNFSQRKSVSLNYRGSSILPSVTQTQPVKANDDPLNIVAGNPDLKPALNSIIYIGYNSYKTLGSRWFSLNGVFNFTPEPISYSIITEDDGRRTTKPTNIKGKTALSYTLSADFAGALKNNGWNFNLNIRVNDQQYFNYQNMDLNTIHIRGYLGRIEISKEALNKYSISINAGPGYTTNRSSLQPQNNLNRFNLNSSASFTLYLPGKMEINSVTSYAYTEYIQSFGNNANPLIWNCSINKKFFKSESFRVSVSGNDLLKQNTGFISESFSQSNATTIQRYFIGSLVWDFSKMGAAKSKK